MRPSEVTGFSSSKYRQRIAGKLPHQLIYDIYKKRRALTTSGVGVVVGVVCAHLTGGASLVAAAWHGRNCNVEKRKLRLLEQEWRSRGGDELPDRYVEDILIPLVISTTIGTFTFCMDVGLSSPCVDSAIAAAFSEHTGLPAEAFPKDVFGVAFSAGEYAAAVTGEKVNGALTKEFVKVGAQSDNRSRASGQGDGQ
jgi:hypothetical protein